MEKLGAAMSEKCAKILATGERCTAWSLKDGPYCYMHSGIDTKALGAKGGAASAYQAITNVHVLDVEPEVDEVEDQVIPLLQSIANELQGMKSSPEVMRTLTQVASTLDRAMERRANRGADVTRIEVEYVNDWRASG